jgi:hypothetical protein
MPGYRVQEAGQNGRVSVHRPQHDSWQYRATWARPLGGLTKLVGGLIGDVVEDRGPTLGRSSMQRGMNPPHRPYSQSLAANATIRSQLTCEVGNAFDRVGLQHPVGPTHPLATLSERKPRRDLRLCLGQISPAVLASAYDYIERIISFSPRGDSGPSSIPRAHLRRRQSPLRN